MPAAVGVAGLLLIVMAWMTLYGTLTAHGYTLGPVLQALARMFDAVRIPLKFKTLHPLRFAAKAVIAVDHSIRHWLAVGIAATAWPIVTLWHACTDWITQSLEASAQLAEAAAAVVAHVVTVTIPGRIAAAEHRVGRRITRVAVKVAALGVSLPWLIAHRINWLHRWALHELQKLARGIDRVRHDLTRTITRDVGRVTTRVKAAERRITAHGVRLGRLEKALAAAGSTALVWTALKRLGLGWTRCSRVGKVGKAVCGMDDTLVDELLEGALLLTGTFGLVAFAREVQDLSDDAADAVRWLVRAS